MEVITTEIVKRDLTEFAERIATANQKLAQLSNERPTNWKAKRKLKTEKRNLEQEVAHVKNLVSIVYDAFPELRNDGSIVTK